MSGALETSPSGILERQCRAVEEYLRSIWTADEDVGRLYQSQIHINQLHRVEFVRCLVKALGHAEPELRVASAFVLFQIGEVHPDALRVFREEFAAKQFQRRFQTVCILSSCNRVPESLVPSLVSLMENDHWCCRVPAAAALLGVPPEDDENQAIPRAQAMSVLRQALRGDESAMTLDAVARLASEYVGDGQVDRASLAEARNALVGTARNLAACAMGRHGPPHAQEAVEILIAGLKSANQELQHQNVYLLLRVGQEAIVAIPTLMEVLKLPLSGADLRLAIASVVGKLGKATDAAISLVEPLIRSLRSENWLVACNVVESLVAMGEAPKAAIQAMVKLLEHPKPEARSMAALSLGKFEERAAEAIPVLIERLKSEPDRNVWRSVIDAVVAIGEPAIPALVGLIEQGDYRLLPLAGESLSRIVGDSPDRLAHILLTHPSGDVKQQAAGILKLMGPKAAPAVPVAAQLLREGDDETRFAALLVLAGIGPSAREALPDLVRVFLAPNPEFSEWAGEALLRIGPDAVAALEAALPDADAAGQERIAALLARLGKPAVGHAASPDYGWIGDDSLVEFFVLIGGMLEAAQGAVAKRQLVREIGQLQSLGTVSLDFPDNEGQLRKWITKLEAKLKVRAGRPIRLIGSKSTRPGALTDDGNFYLQEFRHYLEALGNK